MQRTATNSRREEVLSCLVYGEGRAVTYRKGHPWTLLVFFSMPHQMLRC